MLTPEDKAIIASYMGWKMPCNGHDANAGACALEGQLCIRCEFYHPMNLNDAGLCVEKMVEKGDWYDFEEFLSSFFLSEFGQDCICDNHNIYIAWLFNPDNFFSAMAAWLRSKK